MVKIKGAKTNNLKNIDLDLPQNEFITLTGVSGSGKSSLAFDTIFIEGQRRYVESLPHSARRLMGELIKPDVEAITDITPTISIEQKSAAKNPRSTVGTITEIYDYLRVLFSTLAISYCPISGEELHTQSRDSIVGFLKKRKTSTTILAPIVKGKKGELKDYFNTIERNGFTKIRLDGQIVSIDMVARLDKTKQHDLDVVVDHVIPANEPERLVESIKVALDIGKGLLVAVDDEGKEKLFSTEAYSLQSQISYKRLLSQDFSFNSPEGMCHDCQGLGVKQEYILEKIIDPEKSIAEDCCSIGSSYTTIRYKNIYDNLAAKYKFSVHTPWKRLSEAAKKVFLYGTEKKWTRMTFIHPQTGAIWHDIVQWGGVLRDAYERYKAATSEQYKKKQELLMHLGTCSSCNGGRLQPYPLAARFRGKTIHDLVTEPIKGFLAFFKGIALSKEERILGEEILTEIINRTQFLVDVGLDYLTLDRAAPTLSGGEAQRVRLASQVGSGLIGITYVLDEPSIGLHPRDNTKLIESLHKLRDKGNTVIVVEHDEETILSSSYVVDFGPRAGVHGGHIVYAGDVLGLIEHPDSITGKFLRGDEKIEIPKRRRASKNGFLELKGANLHNLKDITLRLPLGCFVAVTGVSGSGKSSLFLETLFPALHNRLMKNDLPPLHLTSLDPGKVDKIIEIDQSPIGRTPRSNPATYIGLFDEIRKLFSTLPQSKARGYTAGRFSFNVKDGSCSECGGAGALKVDMDFVEDSWIECPKCKGDRFDEETLSIRYNDKNIRDVLHMDVEEALQHFAAIPSIATKLATLHAVGLDYIKLGQSSTTLSGGEAQRIKLARELVRTSTGKTLYILDEPTTGLHFYDIKKLLFVLHSLVEKGNTVVVIEHNMDVVKTADVIIDMGPGSGDEGGQIVFQGTFAQLIKKDTETARALKSGRSRKTTAPSFQKTPLQHIQIKGARQNNLKDLSLSIPHEQITVLAGPSGSGKSSLAIDTIYSEGQRRYVESLSPYIRQFVHQLPKPAIDSLDALTPTIAIERGCLSANPRSSVGTASEIYDYLRLLYARIGIPHCPKTGYEIKAISKEHVAERVIRFPEGEKILVLAPIDVKEEFAAIRKRLKNQGFTRVRLNKTIYDLDDEIPYEAKKRNELLLVIDRIVVDPSQKMRVLEAVEQAAKVGNNTLVIADTKQDYFFNLAFAVEETGESFPEITHHTFAFNAPQGMCPDCQGLGFVRGIDLTSFSGFDLFAMHERLSSGWKQYGYFNTERFFSKHWSDLSLSEFITGCSRDLLLGDRTIRITWRGINSALEETIKQLKEEAHIPPQLEAQLKPRACPACKGTRLNPIARHVTIENKSLSTLVDMPIQEVYAFCSHLKIQFKDDRALQQVYGEIVSRLKFLCDLGLGYLTLNRSIPTLSGGEAQRLKLAKQVGSGLSSVTYILDEPTRGLHPDDCTQIIRAMERLKALRNTLLVIEHNPLLIKHADHLIELGPESGKQGGEVVFQGRPDAVRFCNEKVQAKHAQNKSSNPLLQIKNASIHNLKDLSLSIPLHTLTCVTGVSGSGKSTLLFDVIYEQFRDLTGNQVVSSIILLDQSAIGGTTRSDIATYLDILTPIRCVYALEARSKFINLTETDFSCYHKNGMCKHCQGKGYTVVSMHFMPPVQTKCPKCEGMRYNEVTLKFKRNGKNIGQILEMSIEEAKVFFAGFGVITRRLKTLCDVGLGYLPLGQETHTLSSGEAQRLKLADALAKRQTKHVLYLLDEPTAGLTQSEGLHILEQLQGLVANGHSVIAIEHNMQFIARVDHVIDLGPGAGDEGGRVVAEGSPIEVAKNPQSRTGKHLREMF